jgi:selenocysteine-specific elongation factor
VGEWLTTDDELAAMRAGLVERVESAGPTGVDLASFDDRERAVLGTLDEVVVDATTVRAADTVDPFVDHPYLAAALAGGFTPPQPDDVDRAELRELVRRGHLVVRDAMYFHAGTIDAAASLAAQLLSGSPDGFTVAAFRDATGASRKYVLPLVAELDARGITRRREDLRIAGPRLPET